MLKDILVLLYTKTNSLGGLKLELFILLTLRLLQTLFSRKLYVNIEYSGD